MQDIPGSGRSLEEHVATHPGILAWDVPTTEAPSGLQSHGVEESGATEHALTWPKQPLVNHLHLHAQ